MKYSAAMIKFCANLGWLFTEHAFMDRFAAAAKAGFTGVEFSAPYDHDVGELASRLADHGLKQVLFNLPSGDAKKGERGLACLPQRIHDFRDGVKRALEIADRLSCHQINCLAGITPKNESPAVLWETLSENLNFAATEMAEVGVTLLLEPINHYEMPEFFINTSQSAMGAIAAAGHPNIKLQYDIYHMQRAEGELAATLRRLMPVIGHIQLADNPGRHEPGTGEINYPYLFQEIEKLNYQGWIGCEYKPLAGTVGGLGWMPR